LFENDPAVQVGGGDGTVSPARLTESCCLPEGTHLIGSVVEAKPAGMFGHNGSLRLTFRKVELPAGDERLVHGRVIAAESVKSDRVQIDKKARSRRTVVTASWLLLRWARWLPFRTAPAPAWSGKP
jgi:hypothetical protein